MLFIPLLYFIGLGIYFYKKQQCWNIDIAAISLLVLISFFAILIDINDIYGMYGINENHITLPTILLFCIQWTIILLPIHYIANLPIEKHPEVKTKLLYILAITISIASIIIISTSMQDIKEALVMDVVDRYNDNINNVSMGSTESNYFMLLPQILVAPPFPTLALFIWFYLKTFTNCSVYLRITLLIASIVQSIVSIIGAGRAAMVFWMIDFFLLYSYFYKYLSAKLKRNINITFGIIAIICSCSFIAITISRFDISGRDPMESIYGYAGQHINNFCAEITAGENSPFSIDREFPLTAKLLGQKFNVLEHYENIASHVGILVNVFGTFGGEIYLDLGWIGYIIFFLIWLMGYIAIKTKWYCFKFRYSFIFVILIAFINKGLFYWPLMGHYTTLAIMLMFLNCYLFKYIIKL